jgi:hypothetical protein
VGKTKACHLGNRVEKNRFPTKEINLNWPFKEFAAN